MLEQKTIILISFGYMGLLFAIAFYGDKRAEMGKSIISNPYIYALSLAVYCTAWTFYGSVGAASRAGITGFLSTYIGPTLIMILGWPIIRKIIRISKINRITSIADFIASRYGKSTVLAGIVTIIAVLGIVPYISIQIKAISTTFLLLNQSPKITMASNLVNIPVLKDTAFYVAGLLAIFAVIFGTRHHEATERHEGLVAAIAFESIVKLVAFVAAGIFITYGIYDGFGDLFQKAQAVPQIKKLLVMDVSATTFTGWYNGLFLAMLAVLFLPRQFQVIVVENVDEKHLNKAIWLFPLYLLLINIFVIPVAFSGMIHFFESCQMDTTCQQSLSGTFSGILQFTNGIVDADYFALTLLMSERREGFAMLVFIGGMSAATGMVIVETVALSTMVCNDLVMPVLIRVEALKITQRHDISSLLLTIRRASIILLLLMGYLYFHFVAKLFSLISIGMMSFAAIAQFSPAIIGGIFWKGATKSGAISGLLAGFLIWGYTLVLPSLVQADFLSQDFLSNGPFGIEWLNPHQLFGLDVALLGFDPYTHAVFFSMIINVLLFIGVSLFSRQTEIEQKQATLFVDVFKYAVASEKSSFWRATAPLTELKSLLERFLGKNRTQNALEEYAIEHHINWDGQLTADAGLVSHAEKLLAGAIGSASALVMVTSVVKEEPLGFDEIMDILDETQQILIYSRKLEKATIELEEANARLKELDKLKNEFISTVTHELRTPLTSIRAIAEILHADTNLDEERHNKFSGIIITESERLSRLINDVLDFQKMESGQIQWKISQFDFKEVIEQSLAATFQLVEEKSIHLKFHLPKSEVQVTGDMDRLIQVMVNLISNAVKFSPAKNGIITIGMDTENEHIKVYVRDNGVGISPDNLEIIFEEFTQVQDNGRGRPKGTGIGLTITRHILDFHKGKIWVESELSQGAKFLFTLPLAQYSDLDEGVKIT
ncbi:MAG: histidine kinase [Desulfobacteraceae bacterium]|nr:histidine kinase [Desulfobacteraceae bacterium]